MKKWNFLLIIFFYLFSTTFAQSTRSFAEAVYQKQLEKLREEYGQHKTIPEAFELPALVALSHYPELKNTRIKFKFRKIKATMAAAPTWYFIFQRKKKRRYVISIASDPKKRKAILPIDLDFNEKIGVLGHELGHITWYEGHRIWPILRFGLGQSSKKFRERTEKETDQMAIERGLGWQLHDLRVCTNETCNPPPGFREMKERIYLTPTEIKLAIEALEQTKQ